MTFVIFLELRQSVERRKLCYIKRAKLYTERRIGMKKIWKEWLRKYRYDSLVWTLFVFYEITVVGLISKTFGHPVTYALHYGINIAIFYVHAIWLLPFALKNGKSAIWRVPLILTIEFAGYTLLAYVVDDLLIRSKIITHVSEITISKQFVLTSLYRCIYFLGFATGYYFLLNYIREKNRGAEQEKQSLIKQHQTDRDLANVKNAFLKAQINPHFLFNTLDFVYHSIDTDTNKASEVVILLSRMMRYALASDEHNGFIRIEDEIEQIENLLYLHQLREKGDFPIELICSYEVRLIKFIPLVLLTLVENVLKHGDLSEADEQAVVKVYVKGGHLCIETDNLKNTTAAGESNGIGLTNIQKRLQIAYGSDVYFHYTTTEKMHFLLTIRIPLSCLGEHEMLLDTEKESDTALFHGDVDWKRTGG